MYPKPLCFPTSERLRVIGLGFEQVSLQKPRHCHNKAENNLYMNQRDGDYRVNILDNSIFLKKLLTEGPINLKLGQKELHNLIAADHYQCFRLAAAQGKMNAVRFLWEQSNQTQQQKMLEAENFQAYILAFQGRHKEITAFLTRVASGAQREAMSLALLHFFKQQLTPEMWQNFLQEDNCQVVRSAVTDNHVRILEFLMAGLPPVFRETLLQSALNDLANKINHALLSKQTLIEQGERDLLAPSVTIEPSLVDFFEKQCGSSQTRSFIPPLKALITNRDRIDKNIF